MGKFWTLLTICAGLSILMTIAGFPTLLAPIFDYLGLSQNNPQIDNSTFYIAIVGSGGLLLVSIGGIIAGLLGRVPPDWSIKGPFAAGLVFGIGGTFTLLINHARSLGNLVYFPTLFILGILGIAFLFSAVEWTFGQDI